MLISRSFRTDKYRMILLHIHIATFIYHTQAQAINFCSCTQTKNTFCIFDSHLLARALWPRVLSRPPALMSLHLSTFVSHALAWLSWWYDIRKLFKSTFIRFKCQVCCSPNSTFVQAYTWGGRMQESLLNQ